MFFDDFQAANEASVFGVRGDEDADLDTFYGRAQKSSEDLELRTLREVNRTAM